GQATTTVSITPPTTINIAVYPADAPRGADAKSLTDYAAMRGLQRTEPVRLRIGGDEFLLDPNADEEQQLERLHSFVGGVLNRLEVPAAPGMRLDQDPIVIHCYSGMPWRYACWVYDAVRSFEMDQTPGERLAVDANTGSAHERQVSFAPPRVRAYSEFERGRELQEIMTVR
ncbi:MAG: hypothetical protein PF961_20570, partial [Planctomycetota bacterium]|nr:hypothetical protein [Planctomycetota bacterium]